ncbi:MAG: HDOD domain-containing protein [Sulfurimonas sp.]|nr:HDOD domain-containing protein [Sulfurimonas sp.]
MITKNEINNFIEKIPPVPEKLKKTLSLLNSGELTHAAKVAESDLALKSYLRDIVNKPIYGFKNEVSAISQIFGILGVSLSQQTVYNYMITLLNPDKWFLFKLDSKTFFELQVQLSKKWETILKHLNINDKDINGAITLLPSSIIIAEALFCQKIDEVTLLKNTKSLDYNTILTRLCGIGLFDICEQIAKKWNMDEVVPQIIQSASGLKPSEDENINKLGKWMHLLLFYELSQPQFLKAQLNDFVDFQIEYVNDIYSEFASLMEIK